MLKRKKMLPYLQMHRITFTSLLVISLQHLCQYHQKGFLTNKDYSLSQHQGGAGVGAGGAEQHQEGQIYAAGQSG